MNRRILLIDDEEDIRMVLGVSLKDMGYDVLTAENGEAGLALFRKERPPIVVTDIKMPDIDGLTLLRRIKHESPYTEVIMITGHGDMEAAIESLQQEATDFITKPIDIQTLENALTRVEENIASREKLKEYTENLEGLVLEKSIKLSEVEQVIRDDYTRDEFGAFQNRFRQIFNDVPFYLTVQDGDYRLTSTNRRFAAAFGDHVGRHCYEAFKRKDEPCRECPVRDTFQDGAYHQINTPLVAADGRTFEALVWTAPITDASGRITHVAVLTTEAADVLEVQEHLASLGLMLASVSHGIKGMLTGLDGGVYIMESGLNKERNDLIKEGLSIVKHTTSRIRKMVLDILLFAKERELTVRPVDPAELVLETAKTILPKARECGVEFLTESDGSLSPCNLDPGFLRTALVNVIENAVEACLEDKTAKVHKVVFRVSQDPSWLIFRVQDDGKGMDRETKDRMFDLFFSSKGGKGTGLGMYITNRIIRQHGGEIEVDSEPGRGTVIEIRIPRDLAADELESKNPEVEGAPALTHGRTPA